MDNLKTWAPWGICLAALLSALWLWYHPKTVHDGPLTPGWHDVTTPPGSPRKASKQPPTGNSRPLLAQGEVPASTEGFELSTGFSGTSDEVKIWASPIPRPFFGLENGKELGVRYDFLSQTGSVFGRWTFVRVGDFYGSLYAEGRSGSSYAGAEISYRW